MKFTFLAYQLDTYSVIGCGVGLAHRLAISVLVITGSGSNKPSIPPVSIELCNLFMLSNED